VGSDIIISVAVGPLNKERNSLQIVDLDLPELVAEW